MRMFQWFGRKDDKYVLGIMKHNKDLFTDDFLKWLPRNLHVFGEFAKRALAIKKLGRNRYSARTICEVIRFNSDVRENGGKGYKIDNDMVPYLSRLCGMVFTECLGMFVTRVPKAAIRDSVKRKFRKGVPS